MATVHPAGRLGRAAVQGPVRWLERGGPAGVATVRAPGRAGWRQHLRSETAEGRRFARTRGDSTARSLRLPALLALLRHRVLVVHPLVPSAAQGAHVIDAAFLQHERRTGAREFVLSRTVGDDG